MNPPENPDSTVKTNKKRTIDLSQIKSLPKVNEVGRFFTVKALKSKALLRLQSLEPWYTDKIIQVLLLPLSNQQDSVSLRALDWLVTNYAKKKNILLSDPRGCRAPINIYADYLSLESYWKRPLFDVCRRYQRVYFEFKGDTYETTVAQMNFFHWVSTTGILTYARNHIREIEADMSQSTSQRKAQKKLDQKCGFKRKRHELSTRATVRCNIYPIKMMIQLEDEE
jgi:hypothetical protein